MIRLAVDWEADGHSLKSCGLTRIVELPDDVVRDYLNGVIEGEAYPERPFDEYIGDWLSCEHNWLHNGFSVLKS